MPENGLRLSSPTVRSACKAAATRGSTSAFTTGPLVSTSPPMTSKPSNPPPIISHLRLRLGFFVFEVMRQWTQDQCDEFIQFGPTASDSCNVRLGLVAVTCR